MAPQKLTEYERRRLENIKRNGEMLASLKIHTKINDLSSTIKRCRPEAKSYKTSLKKKPKPETPVVIRRSLRTRGVPPDSSTADGIKDDFDESLTAMKTPKSQIGPKKSGRERGPISMRDAYTGDDSDRKLVEGIMGVAKKCQVCESECVKEEIDGGESEDKGFGVATRSGVCKTESLEVEIDGGESEKRGFSGGMGSRVCNSESLKEESAGGESENRGFGGGMRSRAWGTIDLEAMKLEAENVARVVPGRIMAVRFLPCLDMRMVVVGNKFGEVGFWNMDAEKEDEDGIYVYHPHPGPVSGIVIQPFSLSKIYTSCYDGFIRLMDVEKEKFDLVYSTDNTIFSISQRPNDSKCLFFGEGRGGLSLWDERAGKSSSSWMLHEDRINTIDFNSRNVNIMATSSTDGTACIWDLRYIVADSQKSLTTVSHKRAVHSAYFSPSGSQGFDDKVGLLSGANYDNVSMMYHNNQTGRWISSFRGIWGWDDSYVFIGNMKRGVDVISATQRRNVATLGSAEMSAIPCRFDVHPYKLGTLAAATSGGQVYVWTSC
ncbi:hypothetical protein RJ639_037000 [Escallonia herrerae]|uniref:WD repeat-containing protein 76 n=1 Tax=Escallonia herrerae TaxID=1293975 RepID=A0AA89BAI9_9ASTE|nr:hypothetical protein RJ639_037000 [Escallonia herrerae]